MFNQFIKKPKEELNSTSKPKPTPIAEPVKVPVVPIEKTKKVKICGEGLNELENRVFRFIVIESHPFPVTIWSISNWIEIPESQAEKICEKLVLDPKYRIRKVEHHIAEFALESF